MALIVSFCTLNWPNYLDKKYQQCVNSTILFNLTLCKTISPYKQVLFCNHISKANLLNRKLIIYGLRPYNELSPTQAPSIISKLQVPRGQLNNPVFHHNQKKTFLGEVRKLKIWPRLKKRARTSIVVIIIKKKNFFPLKELAFILISIISTFFCWYYELLSYRGEILFEIFRLSGMIGPEFRKKILKRESWQEMFAMSFILSNRWPFFPLS